VCRIAFIENCIRVRSKSPFIHDNQLHCSTISKCVDVVVQQNGGSVIISTKILGPRSVFRGGIPPEIASPVVPLYVQAKMD